MKFGPAYLALFVSAAVAAAPPPAGMTRVAALSISQSDTKTTVKFPAGTVSVDFNVLGAELYCKQVTLLSQDGSSSTVFLNSAIPLNFHMKQSQKSSLYVSVDIDCHAAAKDGQLIISAGKTP